MTGEKLKKHILFKESFCVNDFEKEYNSYGGNAYGLANTLMQTAFLRPNLRSNKVKNLYFSGQLTVPGPGVPPAIVSGKLVSDLILKMKKLFDQVSENCSKVVTESYSTSFTLATKMLDRSIRQDIYNIYGFVRFADEIVDSFHDFNKEELLNLFELDLKKSIKDKISLNPILNSFQKTLNKYDIDYELVNSFLKSMKTGI